MEAEVLVSPSVLGDYASAHGNQILASLAASLNRSLLRVCGVGGRWNILVSTSQVLHRILSWSLPLSSCQFDAIAGDVYPELYKTFIYKLNPINLDLDFVFSYSCLVNNDFYHRLLIATIAPLLVLIGLAGSLVVGTKRNGGSESALRDVKHKHQAALLYVALFVYSPVSFIIFQTFGCDELDDGETYLRADNRMSYLTSRHRWYETYALTMVAVFPVGMAAAFMWSLFSYRRDLVKSDRETVIHLKPLHGIWAARKPSRYYYEVVECGRRICLTSIAAFVLPNSTAQISVALLFAVVFVFISEALSPLKEGGDMGLYRWGNGVIVACMYVEFLVKVDVGYETNEALLTFSGVLMAANLCMVIAVLLHIAFLVGQLCRAMGSVRMVDTLVRSTRSARVVQFRLPNARGAGGEGGVEMEALQSNI